MSGAEFEPGSVHLADGRRLAYASLGPPDGFPVIYLHGAVGTALTATPELVAAVERLGVRWISLSRPGFGRSDAHAARTLLTVASDVGELARRHGWPQLAVVGVSSGGPYALACGYALPGLVAAVGVTAGISPLCAPHRVPGLPLATRAGLCLLATAPRSSAAVLGAATKLLRARPEAVVAALGGGAAPAVHALAAATERGVRGIVDDYLVCTRPWGFAPSAITAPVHVWHGGRDRLVPAGHAAQLAAAVPRGEASIEPDADHFFFRRRSAEITERLVLAARGVAYLG